MLIAILLITIVADLVCIYAMLHAYTIHYENMFEKMTAIIFITIWTLDLAVKWNLLK